MSNIISMATLYTIYRFDIMAVFVVGIMGKRHFGAFDDVTDGKMMVLIDRACPTCQK
jgi:hypothetical protein